MSRNYRLEQDQNQVTHIKADSIKNFGYALGFTHARERGMQLGFYQALVQSKLSQSFGNEEAFETDQYMAKMGFYYEAKKEATTLKEGNLKDFLKSYCEGVNEGRRLHKPLEFSIFGHKPPIYTIEDILALFKTLTYVGLAQTQQDMQKFVAMSLAKGVQPYFFERLIGPLAKSEKTLAEVIPYLQKTKFDFFTIPENQFLRRLPSIKNSNNWVIGKNKTDLGGPIMAFDPHMPINHLPSLWFECVWKRGPDYTMGITLPGLPVIFMGRNQNLSFSFTYGFMDTIDYFIENVEKGNIQGPHGVETVNKRTQILRNKKGEEVPLTVYETQRGVLEVPRNNDKDQLKDGIYLARAWTGQGGVSLNTLEGLSKLSLANSCDEGCEIAKDFFFSANWLFADRNNNIALQQSGLLPPRQEIGLIPTLAWEKDKIWSSKEEKVELYHIKNPKEDFLISANQQWGELNEFGINLPVANYRYQRIEDFLRGKNKISILESQRLQSDLYSYQAKAYLDLMRSFIPETPTGRILKQWDLTYHEDSKAAFLFEKFLDTLYFDLMAPAIGEQAFETLLARGDLLNNYYGLFDRVFIKPQENDRFWYELLSKSSESTKDKGITIEEMRDQFLEKTLKKTLSHYPSGKLLKWGHEKKFFFKHLFLKGPRFLPWIIGPYNLSGSRATVNQGSVYYRNNNLEVIGPSYRFITSMEKDQAFTILPGGPSDRFYKSSFKSELKRYLNHQYKSLLPS